MLLIARMQIMEGLRDAKLLFMAVLIILAFLVNGIVYSLEYELAEQDWRDSWQATNNELDQRRDNLQHLANFGQLMVKAPSAMVFVSDGGEKKLPNSLTVNAFKMEDPEHMSRGNEMLPTIPSIDWNFIIGTLMTLMALLLSFAAISGEKKDGTLKLLFSFPLPRSALFFGKFLGLLAVTIVILFLGVLVNFTVIITMGIIPLTTTMLVNIGWTLLFAILCLAFFIVTGIMVSSLTKKPAVSLVVLLIFWVISVVTVPGLSKLFGEQAVTIPSNFKMDKELETTLDDLRRKHPDDAGNWNGDPFADNIPRRAAWVNEQRATIQRFHDEAWNRRIQQSHYIKRFSAFSPTGLMNSVFERYADTGLAGFETLLAKGHEYRKQLYEFTKERDALDNESPHLLYSWGESSDRGVFSTKEVELSTVPRSWDLWEAGGVSAGQPVPLFELTVLLLMLTIAGSVAFIALMRYDPR